jgi:23S rRNA (uracil1939-C5)-methyltransferase
VAVKQRVLEDNLWHLGKVRPGRVLRPIEGAAWGYRHRARLSVRYVARKGEVLVGFHERKSRYVADMETCPVLAPLAGALLKPLRALVAGMDQRDRLPQIEVAVGDETTTLVLRHLEPLTPADRQRLADFGAQHRVAWWLQPGGPDTAHPLDDAASPALPPLAYALPAFDVRMPYRPTDFTQVNAAINRVLVSRALGLLQPSADDLVIDWFCGLGNFTLPLARRARQVLGLEGSHALVERAKANAGFNGLDGVATFAVRNLFEMDAEALFALGAADRWLVDPPREGAFALVKALVDAVRGPGAADEPADDAPQLATDGQAGEVGPRASPALTKAWVLPEGWQPPRRIVYVSCNPSTLARDAGLLVHRGGYTCSAAGVVNMFPHTAHVESIAVFDRES